MLHYLRRTRRYTLFPYTTLFRSVNDDGSYVYTLTKPFDTSPDANNGNNTETAESFTYKETETKHNTTTVTTTANIPDDVPTKNAYSGNVAEGALLTVTAAAGVLA